VRVHRFALVGGDPPDEDRAALLSDAIWAQAHPELRLEHVTVIASLDHFDAVLFFHDSAPGSQWTAIELVAVLCARSNIVDRWVKRSNAAPLDELGGPAGPWQA
jgi:hypothetical protein